MKRATGQEVVFPGQPWCNEWWNHLAFRFFRITIWLVCVTRLFYPGLDDYLGMFNGMQAPAFIISGLVLLTLGFLLTITTHFQMRFQWRSGIDPTGPKKIITTGLYQYSRNPMFCFVATAQLGFFMALPSFFSLLCLVIGLYTLNSQAKAEEKHLTRTFPTLYPQYTSQVRRWL